MARRSAWRKGLSPAKILLPPLTPLATACKVEKGAASPPVGDTGPLEIRRAPGMSGMGEAVVTKRPNSGCRFSTRSTLKSKSVRGRVAEIEVNHWLPQACLQKSLVYPLHHRAKRVLLAGCEGGEKRDAHDTGWTGIALWALHLRTTYRRARSS